MATTFTWELQGLTPTEIGETDVIQFAGGAFNDPVFVGEYQDSMHVRESGGPETSDGNTPNNNKFISQAGGTGGDSQADWGDGTEDLDQIANAEAALHILVEEDVNVTVLSPIFFSYNGSNPATPAVGVDVRAAEVGDANFTQAESNASPLELADSDTPATEHHFYIVISKSPTTTGLRSDKLRFEGIIQ